jgi:hypothetical protein
MRAIGIEGAEQRCIRRKQESGNVVDLVPRGCIHGCQSGGTVHGRQSAPPKVALNLSNGGVVFGNSFREKSLDVNPERLVYNLLQ